MSEESSAQSAAVPAHPDAPAARPDGPVSDVKASDGALPTKYGVNETLGKTQANSMCPACRSAFVCATTN